MSKTIGVLMSGNNVTVITKIEMSIHKPLTSPLNGSLKFEVEDYVDFLEAKDEEFELYIRIDDSKVKISGLKLDNVKILNGYSRTYQGNITFKSYEYLN